MDYSEVRIKVLKICSKLTANFSIGDHDYTHQPNDTGMINDIENTIERLTILRNKLKCNE